MLKYLVILLFFFSMDSHVSHAVPQLKSYGFGNRGAPVKVTMYYSITCTHCRDWEKETFPTIQKDYIDTGKIYFEMIDFPIDQLSTKLAQLAWCGGRDKYLPIVKDLFLHQDKWLVSLDPLQEAKKIVMGHGIDSKRCDMCLLDRRAENAIHSNIQYGTNVDKVNGTPTFLIDGKVLEDLLTPAMLEEHLAKKPGK